MGYKMYPYFSKVYAGITCICSFLHKTQGNFLSHFWGEKYVPCFPSNTVNTVLSHLTVYLYLLTDGDN